MKNTILDKIGGFSSFLCAIHCMLMPVVVTLLPYVAVSFFASETMEWLLFASSALMGLLSLCWGFRKHKKTTPLQILAVGLAMIAMGRIGDERHLSSLTYVSFLVAGGCIVALSHWVNHKLCHTCNSCDYNRTVSAEEAMWEKQFSESGDVLEEMADEATNEYNEGRTRALRATHN